jgi:hypothetical protein
MHGFFIWTSRLRIKVRTNSATRAIRSQHNQSIALVPVDYAERGRESTGRHVPTSMKTYNLNIHNIERQFNREKATKETPFVCVCGAEYYNVTFEIFAGGPIAEFIALQSQSV